MLAHGVLPAPARTPKLVAIFCDGSLWSLDGFDPTEAARGGGIGDGATRFRRLHAPTVKDKRLALRRNARATLAFCASPNQTSGTGEGPLCVFAVVGEKELRFATIRGNPGGGVNGSANPHNLASCRRRRRSRTRRIERRIERRPAVRTNPP